MMPLTAAVGASEAAEDRRLVGQVDEHVAFGAGDTHFIPQVSGPPRGGSRVSRSGTMAVDAPDRRIPASS
jgi:hypothetical protein